MGEIEVELRSFVTKEKFEELVEYFKKISSTVGFDNQTTYYFNSKQDLRIQKNDFYSKVWLKTGKMHDKSREEVEIKLKKDDFEKLEKLFTLLDYKVKIKWFRQRHTFAFEEISVMLDYTKGYGYIIEMEIMSNKDNKRENLEKIKKKFKELGIKVTPRHEFEKKFKFYEKNWKKLT